MADVVDVNTGHPMLEIDGERVSARLSMIGTSLVRRTESARSEDDAEELIERFVKDLEAGTPLPAPILTGAAPAWRVLDGALVVEAIRRWAENHGHDHSDVAVRAHAIISDSPLDSYAALFGAESGGHPTHARSERVTALADYLRFCADTKQTPEGYRPLARRFHLSTNSVLAVLESWRQASTKEDLDEWQATVLDKERQALKASHPDRVNASAVSDAPQIFLEEDDSEDIDEITRRMGEFDRLAAEAVSSGRFQDLVVDNGGDHWEEVADEITAATPVLAQLPPGHARTVQEVGGRLEGLVSALKWCQEHEINPRAVLDAVGGLRAANELPFILAMAPDLEHSGSD